MDQEERLLRRKQVADIIGVDDSTINEWVEAKHFPAPLIINPPSSKRSLTAWRKSEVDAWIASRPIGPGRPLVPSAYANRDRKPIKRPS